MRIKSKRLKDNFIPLKAKTFEVALSNFILNETPHLGGPIMVSKFVEEVKKIIQRFYPPASHLKSGQMLWFAVAIDETHHFGKKMQDTRIVPVILPITTKEDIDKYSQGIKQKGVLKEAITRVLKSAYSQGGVLAQVDISVLFHIGIATAQRLIKEYEKEHSCILPYRGTVQDVGSSVTHKALICKKALLEGKTTPDIARETYHHPTAVDAYLLDFARVHFCLKKGMSLEDAAFSTNLSIGLAKQYKELIERFNLLDKEKIEEILPSRMSTRRKKEIKRTNQLI